MWKALIIIEDKKRKYFTCTSTWSVSINKIYSLCDINFNYLISFYVNIFKGFNDIHIK